MKGSKMIRVVQKNIVYEGYSVAQVTKLPNTHKEKKSDMINNSLFSNPFLFLRKIKKAISSVGIMATA